MSAVHATHRFAAFRHVGYRRYFFSRFLAYFAIQIISVAVGWQIYDLTRDPFDLGLIGLFQFLPSLVLILVTGSVADRYNRRMIMGICMAVSTLCAVALLTLTVTGLFSPWPVYAILVVFGIERAFLAPASQSLAPNLVPPEDLANAIAWNSTSWQTATIVGPVAGGLIYGFGSVAPYAVGVCFFAAAALMVFAIPKPAARSKAPVQSWETITAGFRYIKAEKVVLGAISLDLFAVLLGGAVALMPVFARDILDLGPWGLGLLRAAPGVGAVGMAVWLAAHPIRHRAGFYMFTGVALFGLGTVVFGLSATPWISIAGTGGHGRCRHDFGLCTRDPDHAVDAGRAARPRQCRQHGVRRRLQRARRVPGRHDGIRLWRNLCRRFRRRRHVAGVSALGARLPAVAQDRHARRAGASSLERFPGNARVRAAKLGVRPPAWSPPARK